MRALAVLVAFVCMTSSAAASAPTHAALREDLVIAERFWHRQPELCTARHAEFGQMEFSKEAGYATQPEPGEYIPCEMVVSRELSPLDRCATVIHEYGHWLGLEHSLYEGNIMYPYLTFIPRICRRGAQTGV